MLWRIAFAGTLNQEHLKKALCHWVGKEEIPRMEDILKKTTLTIYYQNTLHNLAQWQSTWAWKSHQQVCTNSLFTLPSIYLTIVHPYHRLCHCFSSHSSCHGRFQPVSMSNNMVNTWLSIKSIRLSLTWQPLGKEIHMLWTQTEVVLVQLHAVTP